MSLSEDHRFYFIYMLSTLFLVDVEHDAWLCTPTQGSSRRKPENISVANMTHARQHDRNVLFSESVVHVCIYFA